MRTSVYLTVDTECREERLIGGRVQPAAGYDLRIWGRFQNRRRELGLRLIMKELERHGFRGTFYLDPFGSLSFGAAGLAEVAHELVRRGHDIQLHAHPRQREADWITRGVEPASDHMADYSRQEQAALLQEGKDLLVRAGVPDAQIVSFRAGNFGANNDTWGAMADVGLVLSSNLNPCYAGKGMRMRWEGPVKDLFPVGDGVWELPITNLRQSDGTHRHLQIAAISFLEMRDALTKANRLGYRHVTVVTHSFEFLHIDSTKERRGRLNRINFIRLRALCSFLRRHQTLFEVETVGGLGRNLGPGTKSADPHRLLGHATLRYGRYAEQFLKRVDARLPF